MHDKRTVELLVKDERQALERVMMQFSIYQKDAERIEENSYRITLHMKFFETRLHQREVVEVFRELFWREFG